MRTHLSLHTIGLSTALAITVAVEALAANGENNFEAGSSSQQPAVVPLSFRRLQPLEVQNRQGEKLGSIRDLVIDRRSGQVSYAVVYSGGILGIGSKGKIVPPQALTFVAGTNEVFVLSIDQARFDNAPEFRKDQLASLSLPSQRQQIYAFYNMTWSGRQMASAPPGGAPTPTGRETGEREMPSGPSGPLDLASNFTGQSVFGRDRESLGRISDVLVNWSNGRAEFAILDTSAYLQQGKMYAVPIRLLSKGSDDQAWVLDANQQILQSARPFQVAQWDAQAGSNQIYLYRIPRFGQ